MVVAYRRFAFRYSTVTLSVLTLLCQFLPALGASALRKLPGHVPEVVQQIPSIGRLDPSQTIHLAISLPVRNPDQLQQQLSDLYDPASSQFHHYLTPQEFTDRFGPTGQDYQAVKDFVESQGLQVTSEHGNRMLLGVNGSVANVETAFHVNLRTYQHPSEARTFFAPDTEPLVPSAVPVLDISGLNNYSLPKPKGLHRLSTDSKHPALGSGPDGGDYAAKDIQAAYAPGVTWTGNGQSVGLFEFDGFYPGDIAQYRQKTGLANVPVRTVPVGGYPGLPTPGTNSGNAEVALDIEMAMAMAPGLSQIVVYEADPTNGVANEMLSRIVMDNSCAQISCSWTFGSAPSASTDQLFQQMVAQGQSFINASGDSGSYYGTSIPVPDDSPYNTIVGGTTLNTTGPKGKYLSETVWNAGGGAASSGGVSQNYLIPTWQQGIPMTSNRGSTSHRNVPDVALLADNVFIVADNGQNETITGTSAAAPLWAGVAALANQAAASLGQPRVGFLNPALYALYKGGSRSTYFRDITSGNNIVPGSGSSYSAVVGYDLCTGIGTPVVGALVAKLAITDPLGITPGTGFDAYGPPGGPYNVTSQSFHLTNDANSSLSWSLGGVPNWLTVSAVNGSFAQPGVGTTIRVAVNDLSSALPTGVTTASLQFTNLISGSVQTRTISVHVGQDLVQNGGFETGDFSDWLLAGYTADTYSFVDDGTVITGLVPHSGSWAATLGQNFAETKALGSLSQTLPTTAGELYQIAFWLSSMGDSTGATVPNQFHVLWDSIPLYDVTNALVFDWTYYQFVASAPSSGTTLAFRFTDDPGNWALDDVAVTPVPVPILQAVTGLQGSIRLNWSTVAGLHYQVESTPTLSSPNWTSVGAPILSNGTASTYSGKLDGGSQSFYRVVAIP